MFAALPEPGGHSNRKRLDFSKEQWVRSVIMLMLVARLLEAVGRAQTAPSNDNFANAIPIEMEYSNLTTWGSNDYATKEPGEPDHAGNTGGKSVWWSWLAPGSGYVTISTFGSTSSVNDGWPLNTLLGVYTGTSVSDLTVVASSDDDLISDDGTSCVGFRTTAGTLYRVAVDGYSYDTAMDADSGPIALSFVYSDLAANDNFADATLLMGTNLFVTANNDSATKEPGEPDHAGDPGGKSLWWSWQAPATGFVTISTQGSTSSQTGSDLEALLAVYLGNSVSNLTQVAASSGAGASVTFRVDAGNTYRIAVDGMSYGPLASDAESGTIFWSLYLSPGLPVAPAWGPIPDINGAMIQSTNFSGKVVLLNFWATWCPACVAEIPDLESLYEKYAPDGLVVVGVSVDDSPDGVNPPTQLVASFASENGITYPLLTDRPSWWSIENAYGGINWIPTTFVIDRQNHIWQEFVGSQAFGTFEQAVLPLLYTNLVANLSVSGDQVELSWPETQAAFVPECSTNLESAIWTPVTATVRSDGSRQFVDIPLGKGQMFFRLRGQ